MQQFFEKFGCLSTIVLVVGIVIICKRVDYLCFITHDPVEYCIKFPSGKYLEKALQKVIDKLKESEGKGPQDYFNIKFDNQKRFAAFIEPLQHSSQKDTLEKISRKHYEWIKKRAKEEVFLADFDWRYIESSIEEKYKPEIAAIRADLERRWGEEHSAWDIVCNAKLKFQTDKRRVLEQYLSFYPDGEHALQANELLVSVLQEEVDELEDRVQYDDY